MARFSSPRGPRERPEPRRALLTEPREDTQCDSYAPGHQMHYIHQGQALRSPSQRATNVIVDGSRVVVVLETGEQLDYRYHDPDRLSSVLGLFPSARVVYPQFHALRVGPYWFNCAPGDFEACPPGLEP